MAEMSGAAALAVPGGRPLAGASQLCLSVLDAEGLLFDERRQRLCRLDGPGTLVWCALEEATTEKEAVAWLTERLGWDASSTAAYVTSCLAEWRAAGLIDPADGGHEPPDRAAPLPGLSTAPVPGADVAVFAVAGLQFAVSCPDRVVGETLNALFGHLAVETPRASDFAFEIRAGNRGYLIRRPDGRVAQAADADALAVQLKHDLLDTILAADDALLALHAGAVLSPAGAVVLAGPSGSGKTTLAATLNHTGWPGLSDDALLVRTGRPHVIGLPFAYAIKSSSWHRLQALIPHLIHLFPRSRPDGRVVRYLPPALAPHAAAGTTVAAVVFPQFLPGSAPHLRPLPKADALVRLLGEARSHGRRLTGTGFLSLCAMLRAAKVLRLDFDDPHKAAKTLRQALGFGDAVNGQAAGTLRRPDPGRDAPADPQPAGPLGVVDG